MTLVKIACHTSTLLPAKKKNNNISIQSGEKGPIEDPYMLFIILMYMNAYYNYRPFSAMNMS